jgi:hypothetical protein
VADLPQVCDEAQAWGFRKGPAAQRIIMAGCGQWPNAVPDTMEYDSTTNSWAFVGAFNENRRNHAGALYRLGRRWFMFILGGYGEPSGFIDPLFSSEIGGITRTFDGAPAGSGAAPAGASGAASLN